jgi:HPt (histidine-containing phosphotransfer) domain-containing protein
MPHAQMPPMPRAPSGMRQHAHRVKGAAGNLGMKALQETCALLEHNAKEGIWSAEMLPEIREVNLTLALALALALALTLTSTLTLARCLPRSERTLPQSGRAGRPTFDFGARSAMPQCMVCRGMLTISS